MNRLAIACHSAQGHTEHLTSRPGEPLAFDGLAFGSPNCLGGVSGPFKRFMHATGRMRAPATATVEA